MAWILLFIILFLVYAILIFFYYRSWTTVPLFENNNASVNTTVTVVVAARNEEENIGALLDALQRQAYPAELIEVIVVDDHSSDRTAEIVEQYPMVRLIRLQADGINAYKKKAIDTAVRAASNEWIIATDADCIPPATWIEELMQFQEQTDSLFIVAPVLMNAEKKVVEIFQAMDFMVLQGITAASVYKQVHSMCNGANLAYSKKVFLQVDGFANVDHIASGDDMLLMHKIWKQYPGRIGYLKSMNAIVPTQPMHDWRSFFNQRIRWASKARYYDDKRIFCVLLLVYVFNLFFAGLAITALVQLIKGDAAYINTALFLLIAWIAKTAVELPFYRSLSRFFRIEWTNKWFFLFQPLHIAYTIIAGFLGSFGKYQWKNRSVR